MDINEFDTSSPIMSSNKKKKENKIKKKTHHRSLSTDDKKGKSLKLEEWKSKYKNIDHVRSKSTTKFKKLHKMDFNLYNIEIKPNKRYRLSDGRIGIAKYKGKTAFGKGTETYIGILLEYGEGEHNGTVYNKTYFRCKFGKGIFVHPFQIIQDLGNWGSSPVTQEMIDDANQLVKESQTKITQYLKKHNIKKNKKMY
eukprot:446844_1